MVKEEEAQAHTICKQIPFFSLSYWVYLVLKCLVVNSGPWHYAPDFQKCAINAKNELLQVETLEIQEFIFNSIIHEIKFGNIFTTLENLKVEFK